MYIRVLSECVYMYTTCMPFGYCFFKICFIFTYAHMGMYMYGYVHMNVEVCRCWCIPIHMEWNFRQLWVLETELGSVQRHYHRVSLALSSSLIQQVPNERHIS